MTTFGLILAGGEGKRFQPISTPEKPKQFLNLYGNASLLQHTYQRIQGAIDPKNIYITTNEKYLPFVHEQLPNILENKLITETVKKKYGPLYCARCLAHSEAKS